MDPRLGELKSLLKSSRKRPRSTEWVFFTKSACAKALGRHSSAFRAMYSSLLPPLPITRASLERWWEVTRRDRARTYPDSLLVRILKWKGVHNFCRRKLKVILRMKPLTNEELYGAWKAALKNYERLKSQVPGLPSTVEELLQLIEKRRQERASYNLRKYRRAQGRGRDAYWKRLQEERRNNGM